MIRSALLVGGMVGAACSAAELTVFDLRLGVDLRPTDFDYEVSNDFGSASGADSFDSGFGTGVRFLYSFRQPGSAGGFTLGGEATAAIYDLDDGGFTHLALRGMGGYSYALTDSLTIDAIAYAGYGYGDLEIPSNDLITSFSADGGVTDFGAIIGLNYTFGRHWVASAEVGWTVLGADLTADDFDIRFDQTGPTFFLGIGYRFGGLPQVLQ